MLRNNHHRRKVLVNRISFSAPKVITTLQTIINSTKGNSCFKAWSVLRISSTDSTWVWATFYHCSIINKTTWSYCSVAFHKSVVIIRGPLRLSKRQSVSSQTVFSLGLRSTGRSYLTDLWYDSWVQTIYSVSSFYLNGHTWLFIQIQKLKPY